MQDYHIETLDFLRSNVEIFKILTDEELSRLYSKFSQQSYSAGWLDVKHLNLKRFETWCRKSPMQLILEERNSDNKLKLNNYYYSFETEYKTVYDKVYGN